VEWGCHTCVEVEAHNAKDTRERSCVRGVGRGRACVTSGADEEREQLPVAFDQEPFKKSRARWGSTHRLECRRVLSIRWGHGQRGRGDEVTHSVPRVVGGTGAVVGMAGGDHHSLAITKEWRVLLFELGAGAEEVVLALWHPSGTHYNWWYSRN
jgi:hypothetical protein